MKRNGILALLFLVFIPIYLPITSVQAAEDNDLFYFRSARTLGKGNFSLGLNGLMLSRDYFFKVNNTVDILNNDSFVGYVPIAVGLTDYLDAYAGFNFFYDARPWMNESDIYQYHGSLEAGIGSTRAGLKIRTPLRNDFPFQVSAKIGVLYNSSFRQIDGMLYQWTRAKGTDVEASILESIDMGPYATLHFEQGYVVSGSELFDDQIVLGAGIGIQPHKKVSLDLGIYDRTFTGRSPQSVLRSVYTPFEYWDTFSEIGDPSRVNDTSTDFGQDYFVFTPSLSLHVNEATTLHAGAAINIADQKGPREPYQILVGISYRGNLGDILNGRKSASPEQQKAEPPVSPETPVAVVDLDGDGVTDSNDKQPNTPKGAVTDMWGVALDSDNDGVYDGLDKEPNTTPGSVVDGDGVALDDDGDGVPNGIDRQLDTPKGAAVDVHGVALDDDGDGVPNAVDREPNTPGNRAVDQFGVSVKLDDISNLPYSIHVESYLTRNSAEESASRIRARGNNAFTVYTLVPGKGYWYRVYIGHYKTELEAKGFSQKLKASGLFDYIAVTKIQ